MKNIFLLFVFVLFSIYSIGQCVAPATPTISTFNSSRCYNEQTIITADIDGASLFFEWYKDNILISSAGGLNRYSIHFFASEPGVYKVRYYITSDPTCYSAFSNEISITIKPYPTLQIIPITQEICSGQSTSFTLSNPNNVPGTTFSWTADGAGSSDGNGNTISQALTNSQSTWEYATYSVKAIANGCVGETNQAVVRVYSSPRINANSPTTVCEGGQVLLAGVPNQTYGGSIYWQKNGVTISSGPGIGATSSGAYTYRIDTPGSPGCHASSDAVIVNVLPTPTVTINPNPTAICSGTSVTLTANHPQSGNFGYVWFKSGSPSPVGGGQNYVASSSGNYVVLVDNIDCLTGNENQGVYRSNASASIAENAVSGGLISNNQTVCNGGNPVAFSNILLPSGNGVMSYQWQSASNGGSFTNINGATSIAYDPPIGIAETTYYKRITYSLLNGVTCSAESNSLVVNVLTVTGGQVSGDQSVCSNGNPGAFTESNNSTGPFTLSYQWQSSTDNITFTNINGANATTYDPPAGLLTTTYYKRITVGNGTSCIASSNIITVSVNSVTGGTVGTNQTICNDGDPAAFTQSAASTGAGTLSYQWQRSPDNITFTNISEATAIIYDAPAGLTATTYYKRITTSTLNSVTCAAISNPIIVSINSVTGGIVGSNQTICQGGDPTAFTQTTASTGPGTLSYQWQSSTDNVTFNNISGATAITYNVPAGLTQTTYYKRLTSATQNSLNCSASSNTLIVTVSPLSGGTIAGNQTVCSGGDPAAFTQTVAATGPGTLSYQWQSSTNGSTFSNISGATSTTYNVPAGVTQTTYYKRIVTSNLGCTSESNSLTVTVSIPPVPTISSIGCMCEQYVTLLASSGGTNYVWSNGYTGQTVNMLASGSYSVTVTYPSGCSKQSGNLFITIPSCSPDPCDSSPPEARKGQNIDMEQELIATSTTVYPNPADAKLYILLPEPVERNISVKLYSQYGFEVGSTIIVKGKNKVEFDTKLLEKGMYTVLLQNSKGQTIFTRRFLIAHP